MTTPEILFRQFSNSSFEEGTFASLRCKFGSMTHTIRISNHTPFAILELIEALSALATSKKFDKSKTYILGPFYYDYLDVQIGVTGGVYQAENCYDATNREIGEELGLLSKELKECYQKPLPRSKTVVSKFLIPISSTFPVTSAIKKIGTDNGKRIASVVYGSLDEIRKYLGSTILRWRSTDKIVGVAAIRLDLLQRALNAPQKYERLWRQNNEIAIINDRELGRLSTCISIDSIRKFVFALVNHSNERAPIVDPIVDPIVAPKASSGINVNQELLFKLIYSTLNLPEFSLTQMEKEVIESTYGKGFPAQMTIIGQNHLSTILTHYLISTFPTETEYFQTISNQIMGDSIFPIIEYYGLRLNLIDDQKSINLLFSLIGLAEFILKKNGVRSFFEVLEERVCSLLKIDEMVKRTIESVNMSNMYESQPQIKMMIQ